MPPECVPAPPPMLDLSVTWSYTGCDGDMAVDLTVANGSGSYWFYWTPAWGGNTPFYNTEDYVTSAGGTYTVHVQDINTTEILVETFTIGMIGTVTDALCNGVGLGAVDLIPPTDLVAPYIYYWYGPNNFFAATEDISGVLPGPYWVVVVGDDGCQRAARFNIQGASLDLFWDVTPHGWSCSPHSGAIDLTVTGGAPPYTYNWSNGATTEDISDLLASFYTVQVTDANNCAVLSPWIIVPRGNNIEVVADEIRPSCSMGATGSIEVTASGGTPPYSYHWTRPGFSMWTEDLFNVNGNTYYLDITDANGCEAQYSFHVPEVEDMELIAIIDDTPSCGNGGSIDLTVSGGTTPYSFLWNVPGGSLFTEDITGMYSGTYGVFVEDANECMVWETYVIGGTPKTVDLTAAVVGGCSGSSSGSVDITMIGGIAPFSFTWSGPGGLLSCYRGYRVSCARDVFGRGH